MDSECRVDEYNVLEIECWILFELWPHEMFRLRRLVTKMVLMTLMIKIGFYKHDR